MNFASRNGVALAAVAGLVCCCPTVSPQQETRPSAKEAPLPRKPMFGVQIGPVTKEVRERQKLDGTEGVLIEQVFPHTTAAEAGFKPGDVILSLKGSKVAGVAPFLEQVAALHTGDTVAVVMVREGEKTTKQVTMREKPRETSDDYDITYGHITSRGSRLRTIVTRPKAPGRHPAVLLLQGYGCGSIDNPMGRPDQLAWLARDLTLHGYVVMRVDRHGSGDSEGPPCRDIDLETELGGYRQALKALKGFPFVDAGNVFLFGYSLGGITAPLVAMDEPVKGIAFYGTGSKTWYEAVLEQRRFVMAMNGTAPAEVDRQMNRWARLFTYLFLEKMRPAEVAEKHPDLRDLLKVQGAEGDYINGRHYRFHHQLAERSIDGAWAKVDAEVLALWGKSDWICAGYFDERIAQIVNQAHPGRATFVALDGIDHAFFRVPSPEASFRLEETLARKPTSWPEYNPVVLETLRGWLAKVSGKVAHPTKPAEGRGTPERVKASEKEGRGETERHWTIFFYGAGDGGEKSMMRTLGRVKEGFVEGQGVEIVALADRSGAYADGKGVFGENFKGARLYRFAGGRAERLDGGREFPEVTKTSEYDVDMGDADTLKKFVRFGKARYPARCYALIFFGHGCGAYFCPDETHGNALQPAKVSAVLTREDSVDLVVLDACAMGGIEVAYQWRPGNGGFEASVMVASPTLGDALPYDRILAALRGPPRPRKDQGPGVPAPGRELDPAALTPLAFGRRIVAETEAHRREEIGRERMYACEAWACYDLTQAGPVKKAVDALAVELARTDGAKQLLGKVRGTGTKPVAMHYMDAENLEKAWAYTPFFDLYDLARRVREGDALPAGVKDKAGDVMRAVGKFVVGSFGQRQYPGFEPGKNGVSILLPDGDAVYQGKRHWEHCRWYTPLPDGRTKQVYGRLSWCKDGATPGNRVVENWFELLDSWYDTTNDETGGLNGYRW